MQQIMQKLEKLTQDKRTRLLLVAVLILMPAILLTAEVIGQSRNTPWMDQWELVTNFRQIDEGTYGVDDVWRQHNEHRLVFPKLLMIGMAYATHWNVRAEMLLSIILALGMLVVLGLLVRSIDQVTKNKWVFFLTMLVSSVIVFSLGQAENWLWGWQIQWYLACLSFLAMLWCLNRNKLPTKYLILAIIAAFVSTYSLGNGQFSWLIGGLILYVNKEKLRVWATAATVSIVAYQINLQRTGLETPLSELILHPLKPIAYFFVYIGRPISANARLACVAGFFGFVLFTGCIAFIYLKQKGSLKERSKVLVVPAGFALFALLSAAITTVSRSSLGIGQATASRYITVSNFFWIGLVLAFVIAVRFIKFRKSYHQDMVTSNALCLILALAVVASSSSSILFTQHNHLMKTLQYCTNSPRPTDECLMGTYPHPDIVRDRVEYLKQKGWAGYSDARQSD